MDFFRLGEKGHSAFLGIGFVQASVTFIARNRSDWNDLAMLMLRGSNCWPDVLPARIMLARLYGRIHHARLVLRGYADLVGARSPNHYLERSFVCCFIIYKHRLLPS